MSFGLKLGDLIIIIIVEPVYNGRPYGPRISGWSDIYSMYMEIFLSLTDDLDFLFLARVLRTPACLAPPALSKRACIKSTWDMILFNCLVYV